MKIGKQILALFLSFWLLVSTVGYAEVNSPLCCAEMENACCPMNEDGTPPDCCQVETDYHHEENSKATVAPLKVTFGAVRASVPTFFFSKSLLFTSKRQELAVTFTGEDFIPLPPRLHFAWVQCWRL